MAGSLKPKSAPPNTHTLMSDLSDLSSVTSASEPTGHADRSVNPENSYERGDSNKVSNEEDIVYSGTTNI